MEQLQSIALVRKFRITFLSGDVHCAAVGYFKTLSKGKKQLNPEEDHRYMLNVVSHAPPFHPYRIIDICARRYRLPL